jgi:hypothetical protein
MKTWGELTDIQRTIAFDRAKHLLATLIVEGVIEGFRMPNTVTQRTFDMILRDAKNTDNPKSVVDLLYATKDVGKELNRVSLAISQGSRYDDSGNAIMNEH